MRNFNRINIDSISIRSKASVSNGIDSFTKLMLHMDGTNGGTTFTDSSLSPHTMVANGGAVTSTAQKVFGTASGLMVESTSSYVSSADHADWYFGDGDFTVDFRVRFNSIGVGEYSTMISQYESSTKSWDMYYRQSAGILAMLFQNIVAKGYVFCSWTPSLNTWYHLQFVRNGANAYIFIDGISQSLTTVTSFASNDVGDIAGELWVGGVNAAIGNFFDGYLDEVRVSKGIARNTSNFTPPTSPYTT